MTQAYRNAWIATIVSKFLTDAEISGSFFELNGEKLYILGCLAETMHIKSSNGKSPARTLFDRAKKGMLF